MTEPYTEEELRSIAWEVIQPALGALQEMPDAMTPVILNCETPEQVQEVVESVSQHITNLLIDGTPECDPSLN